MRQRLHAEHEHILVVSDIDETLLNSVAKHHQELTKLGQQKNETRPLPTYEELLAAGGTHKAYQQFEWYPEANEQMRNSPEFNKGLERIDGSLPAMLLLAPILLKYLTTRPEHLAELSSQELVRSGFAKRPVVARPNHIPLAETNDWKISVLEEDAKIHDKKIVMIDDSPSLHRAILSLGNPLITALLFQGPITNHREAKTWKRIMHFFSEFFEDET